MSRVLHVGKNRLQSLTSFLGISLVTLAVFVALGAANLVAQQEKILHNFAANGKDGYEPYAGVVFDAVGNLYGATFSGGTYGNGTVYELSPQPSGWTEKILHNFNNNGRDGYQPYGGLVPDALGKLYGTTRFGGTYGDGVVYELTPNADGNWTEKILHSFNPNTADGLFPYSTLAFDAAGNLYGTTFEGGSYKNGTVFELTPTASGAWIEKILHSFNPNSGDGYQPYAGVALDSAGNLYGTTSGCLCSYSNYGTVFELKHNASGGWTELVLHAFTNNGVDGYNIFAGVTLDAAGNLYGATNQGGGSTTCGADNGCGTVFKLTPTPTGAWTETIIHIFADDSADGGFPTGSVIFDGAGNLYGTATAGGPFNSGSVFKLAPGAGGSWTEMILHNFSGNSTDGYQPYAGLILDSAGNLFGTTLSFGAFGGGVVFEVRP